MSGIRRQTGVILDTVAIAGASGTAKLNGHADCVGGSIQVEGSFASAAVNLQASNDGVTFYNIVTTASTNGAVQTSLTTAGLSNIPPTASHGYNFYRLSWSGGGGGTAVTVTVIFVERNRR